MPKARKKDKEKTRKGMPPSSYVTMPHYYPTEQMDVVEKMKSKRRKKK